MITAMDRLAHRCGIQDVSEDAFGKEHRTSAETKRALIEAMGYQAGDEQAAEASLNHLIAQDWQEALPPVCVVYLTGDVSIPVTLPATTEEVRWLLTLEGGATRQGSSRISELPLSASHALDGALYERRSLSLSGDLPWGYHKLTLEGHRSGCTVIATPGSCWLPPEDGGDRRFWGLAAQLYLLRSQRNWGIGDFTDLAGLVALARERGADVVGLSPLHAMFPDQPEQASPYSPSDRLLLNVLYIDVERVPEFTASAEAKARVADPDFQQQVVAAREAPLVQYAAVAAMKLPLLRLLFEVFEQSADAARHIDFRLFRQERGAVLERACLFQALRAFFAQSGEASSDCSSWPEAYRTSISAEQASFAREHPDLVRFQMWLQWIADTQLQAAAAAAQGMGIGLYRDLAVGASPGGAEVWTYPGLLVSQASVGAPPDIWNPTGQNWGLPPLHPRESRRHAYTNFVELLRANMRYAGALRIDHALALQRLYWIPKDGSPAEGAYVDYPMEDLIGILALESHRNKTLVIGEDLGTVPEGFRKRMAAANVLSYRVLYFERDEAGFFAPDDYPRLALSVASSHDLPTLRGWWQQADIETKQKLALFPPDNGAEKAHATRQKDQSALVAALREQELLDRHLEDIDAEAFAAAAHRFLGRTASLLTLVQLDDITGEMDQVNIPATTDEHPNWRRKLALTLEQLRSGPELTQVAEDLRLERSATLTSA